MTTGLTDTAAEAGYSTVEVSRLTANIGARIDGIRIGADLDPRQLAEVRQALLRHRVVFFRGQDHVEDADHIAFAEQLGTVTKGYPSPHGSGSMVLEIGGKAKRWHTDISCIDRAPAISILRAVDLTPYGGSTAWANTVSAYESLHPGLQALADRLWAVHTNSFDRRDDERIGGVDVDELEPATVREDMFETEHPVVRVHPETGERSLMLGNMVRRIVGLAPDDSQALFDLFQRHITRMNNTIRWDWRPGDMAMWDNRSTQHCAIDDYDDHPRLMHRVTLAGDLPVSVDGVRSTPRVGDASCYSPIASFDR